MATPDPSPALSCLSFLVCLSVCAPIAHSPFCRDLQAEGQRADCRGSGEPQMPRSEAVAGPGAASEDAVPRVFSPLEASGRLHPLPAPRPPGPEKEGRGTVTILLGLGPPSASLQPGSGASVTTGR